MSILCLKIYFISQTLKIVHMGIKRCVKSFKGVLLRYKSSKAITLVEVGIKVVGIQVVGIKHGHRFCRVRPGVRTCVGALRSCVFQRAMLAG